MLLVQLLLLLILINSFYYKYCPHRLPYCIQRYTNEVTRLLGVLEQQLSSHNKHWILGDMFTIADLAIWPWIFALHENYDNAVADAFSDLKSFPLVKAYYARYYHPSH
jgi:GST-like protein